jgi:hypothetical protein
VEIDMSGEFDHLPDTLDEIFDAPTKAPVVPANGYQSPRHIERCQKCRGTGQFTGWSGRSFGPCFACKGKGQKEFATSSAQRAQAKTQRVARETNRQVENVEAFKAAQPEIFAWIQSSGDFPFAIAMLQAVGKYGALTDNQLAACQRCVDGRKKAQEARTASVAAAPVVDVTKIETALSTARANGLKNPKIRVSGFKFSAASPTSANPGAIYVKEGSEYLGKIVGGKVLVVGSCGTERRDAIVAICVDPKAAAIAHGRMTGSCSCCGRELIDPVSIEKGIGPICEEKFGW